MEEKHRKSIQRNYVKLINEVDLYRLIQELESRSVLTERQLERFYDDRASEKDKKRYLFEEIQTRGPQAFEKLVESLKAINNYVHEDLALALEGKLIQIKPSKDLPSAVIKEQVSSGAVPFMLPPNQRPSHIRQISQETPKNYMIDLSQEPLKVKVVKSTHFYDDPKETKVPIYRTRSKFRGAYLGINNIQFSSSKERRNGAEVDEKNLKDLFEQIGFNKIVSKTNQTRMDMRSSITEFTKDPELRKVDCVVVAIMSHGEEGDSKESSQIVTSDELCLPVSWILDQFSNANCKQLIGKPKIFMFQICRGMDPNYGVREMNRIQTDGGTMNFSWRDISDMLIAFSTLPGYQSYRDIYLGSWFIEEICRVFMKHAHDTDVEHLLKIVDQNLSGRRSEKNTGQTSSYECRGFKQCFLHPGLFE